MPKQRDITQVANLDKYGFPVNPDMPPKPLKQNPWIFGMQNKIKGKSMIMDRPQLTAGSYSNPTTSGGTFNSGVAQSMTILNNQLGTIIDKIGLLSLQNFANDGWSSNTTGTVTNTSYGSVSGSGLSPLVLTRNARVMTNTVLIGQQNNNNNTYKLHLSLIDSLQGTVTNFSVSGVWFTTQVDIVSGNAINALVTDETVSVPSLTTFSAGTHTMYLQDKVDAGGTGLVTSIGLFYVVLGN